MCAHFHSFHPHAYYLGDRCGSRTRTQVNHQEEAEKLCGALSAAFGKILGDYRSAIPTGSFKLVLSFGVNGEFHGVLPLQVLLGW
jgi:hypothetical protein